MTDNTLLPPATGGTRFAATDEATYSGDLANVQLVRVVEVTGAEGSKTVISPNAVISAVNSSTALLLLNGTFTGTGEDVSEYTHITVSLYSSHATATDGLQLQQSTNNVDWDFVDAYTVPATTGKSFSAPVQAKWFRVVHTNGGVMQTAQRLQTIYSKRAKKGSSVRPQDGRSNENDFEETLAYGMGWNGTNWDRIKSTTGALNVVQTDVTSSGTLTAAAQTVAVTLNGNNAGAAQITGTWVGTITFEASLDGTTWTAINAVSASTSTPQTTTTANGLYRLTPGGVQQIRANMTAFTSGSATISLRASAGAGGTFANQILPTKNTDGVNSQAIKAANTAAAAADQAAVVSLSPNSMLPGLAPTVLWVTATAATGVAATASLPAAGAGLFHYITAIDIQLYATAARTGSATPVIVATTNLPGSPAWNFPTAQAIGVNDRYDVPLMTPIKSSVANTITTVAAPIATTGLWRINVGYYTGA